MSLRFTNDDRKGIAEKPVNYAYRNGNPSMNN